jgi:hypothetical protein
MRPLLEGFSGSDHHGLDELLVVSRELRIARPESETQAVYRKTQPPVHL